MDHDYKKQDKESVSIQESLQRGVYVKKNCSCFTSSGEKGQFKQVNGTPHNSDNSKR